jgi:hypothetical protein
MRCDQSAEECAAGQPQQHDGHQSSALFVGALLGGQCEQRGGSTIHSQADQESQQDDLARGCRKRCDQREDAEESKATMTAFLRPILSPSEPRLIAPIAIPIVLAVMTHVISAACIPNSSAMAGPMNAIDCVSKPSSSAMVKQRPTNTPAASVHRAFIDDRLNFKLRADAMTASLEMALRCDADGHIAH